MHGNAGARPVLKQVAIRAFAALEPATTYEPNMESTAISEPGLASPTPAATPATRTPPPGVMDAVRDIATKVRSTQRDEPMTFWASCATIAAFVWLFGEPVVTLAKTWWENPDAGHGLLLAPVAGWLAWQAGRAPGAKAQPWLGGLMLVAAIGVRSGAGLAAGLTLARAALLLSVVGITVFFAGWRQIRHWWLPFTVIALSMPIPDFLMKEIALPLQMKASELGATMLRWRDVPVLLAGNVIRLPGHELFVTEACSGLRSLTALIAMAVLLGGLMLDSAPWRVIMIGFSLVVAVLVNGFRVFLTGFLVYFVDPKLAEGFMHLTEGFLLFLVSMAFLMGFLQLARWGERFLRIGARA